MEIKLNLKTESIIVLLCEYVEFLVKVRGKKSMAEALTSMSKFIKLLTSDGIVPISAIDIVSARLKEQKLISYNSAIKLAGRAKHIKHLVTETMENVVDGMNITDVETKDDTQLALLSTYKKLRKEMMATEASILATYRPQIMPEIKTILGKYKSSLDEEFVAKYL